MDKFTWVVSYKEIASKLKDYKDRQLELIKILTDLQKRGLPTISRTDKNEKGEEIPLKEIDPFTFFANFNRGIKTESRIEIIKTLKELWGLSFSIPSDFTGTPVVNNQSTWFFAWQKDRGAQDINVLWELFIQALENNINPLTFNAALKQKMIKFNITMGLFWINADRYLNLDSVNRSYLEKNGIKIDGLPDFQTYVDYTEKTKKLFQKPFFEISHDAWLDSNHTPVKTEPEIPISPNLPRYWLYAPGRGGEHWEEFYSQGIMAIGWDYMGDLRQYSSKENIAHAMRAHDNEPDASKKNNATSCFSFCNQMQTGDVVYAKIGRDRIVGRGIILSDYAFDDSRDFFRHIRKVDWKLKGEWTVADDSRFALKTITDITGYHNFIKHLNSLLEDNPPSLPSPVNDMPTAAYSLDECAEATGFAKGRINSWKSALDRKKQAVFYGPPGTGKTFLADHLSRHIVGGTDGFVECIQFHPAYTYEEFIQGIRPETDEKGNLQFALKSGRFLEFCSRAGQHKGPCVLIIDEINRANLARVFGELMYLLEYREKDMPLAGGLRFSIPDNVRLIGTMNTADRSIALVDFALRRRFAFLELSPEYDVLWAYQHRRNFNADGLVLVLHDVNAAINDKNFHLGISFFLTDNLSGTLEEIWKLEIEPYLEEYFFSQPEAMIAFRWDKIKERLL